MTAKDLAGLAGVGSQGLRPPLCPASEPLLAWQTDPACHSFLARGPKDTRGGVPQAPPLVDQPPFLFLLGMERFLPMALSWGEGSEGVAETDKCNKDRRSSWRDGHLTYQAALQDGCGRRRGDRKKECVKDSRMSHSWGGVGAWDVWGAGCSLGPTRHVGVSCVVGGIGSPWSG